MGVLPRPLSIMISCVEVGTSFGFRPRFGFRVSLCIFDPFCRHAFRMCAWRQPSTLAMATYTMNCVTLKVFFECREFFSNLMLQLQPRDDPGYSDRADGTPRRTLLWKQMTYATIAAAMDTPAAITVPPPPGGGTVLSTRAPVSHTKRKRSCPRFSSLNDFGPAGWSPHHQSHRLQRWCHDPRAKGQIKWPSSVAFLYCTDVCVVFMFECTCEGECV